MATELAKDELGYWYVRTSVLELFQNMQTCAFNTISWR